MEIPQKGRIKGTFEKVSTLKQTNSKHLLLLSEPTIGAESQNSKQVVGLGFVSSVCLRPKQRLLEPWQQKNVLFGCKSLCPHDPLKKLLDLRYKTTITVFPQKVFQQREQTLWEKPHEANKSQEFTGTSPTLSKRQLFPQGASPLKQTQPSVF